MSSDSEWVDAERGTNPERAASSASGERSAAEHLAALGATAEWEQRAEWLEAEAKAHRDPAARARLMLAASEARALLGARADARRLAVQAVNHQPAPAFAVRQARALHQAAGDISAAHRSLVDEARNTTDPRLAAHDQYVAAELQRLLQRDAVGARANFEAAERANPDDLRASLGRLVLTLSQSQSPPERDLVGASARELGAALDAICRLRGDDAEAPAEALEEHADALALVGAERALRRGHLGDAADALARLEARPGLKPAVRWLRALWTAAAPERAEQALGAWRELARELPGRHSRRALAARALGAHSPDAVREALAELDATPDPQLPARATRPSFSSSERAALTALVGQRPEPADLDDSDEASAVGFIATAVARASSRPPGAPALDAVGAEAEFELGRAVASVARLSDLWVPPDAPGPWARVLRLEQSREQRDLAALARELPALSEQPLAVAEASFVSAVLAEVADDPAAARRAFQASLPSPITREAATRALCESSVEPAPLLRALSAHTSEPLRRALLLTEVLFQLDPAAPEFEALAEDAARTFPELGLSSVLGEAAARARGDRGRVTRWLARAREQARGRDEQTLAAWREALHLLEVDRPAGLAQIKELFSRSDTPLSIQLSCEDLLDLPATSRAEWRRRVAASLSERGRQRLLAQAVFLHDAAGEADAALAAARELGGPLGELWATRRMTSDEDLDRLARDWAKLAQRTTDVELSAELYARLARLEQRRGRGAQALAWQRERLAIEPASLPALRALEIADMDGASLEVLEQSEGALFEALGERDGLGHAYVATRLAVARGAYEEARPIVRRVQAMASPPLWALRHAGAYARDAGDDRALLANYRSLRDRSSQALDAATLSLHAAEAALRMGDHAAALDDIQRASELAPDDIVILSVRAEVLLRAGAHAEAAEAFETLASATSSKKRQTEALYQAAVLWLDHLGHRARGMLALQEAAAVDVPHAGLLERLVSLRSPSDDLDGLGELIERQRKLAAERPAAALDLSQALDAIDAGELDAARLVLDGLLAQRPDDTNVLMASAELHVRQGGFALAEPQFRRAIELSGPGHTRNLALSGLAQLYEGELARPEELAPIYQELLAHDPDNGAIRRRLVALFASRRQWAEAAAQQREALARAPDEEARKSALLYLVKLLEQGPDTAEESLSLLEQARHTWPEDPRVLEAEVTHHQSAGDHAAARVITERALAAARAAIAAGRLDAAPFRTIQAAARLGGNPDTASVASATGSVIGGAAAQDIAGIGARALDPSFDDLVAPSWPSAPFRRLLYAAGAAIERAYPSDLDALATEPAPDTIGLQLAELALAAGIEPVRFLVSSDLGAECRSRDGASLTLVLGAPLVAPHNRRLLEATVVRELKLAQARAGALSRMAPDECWATLAGFFACFGQACAATGSDAQRVARASSRLRPHVTWLPESDLVAQLPALASEVLPRAGDLPRALRSWATRCALLAVGDLGVALDSAAAAARSPTPLPRDEDGRMRWIAAHPEAHDLVRYGVSEAYMQARRRAGLVARSP